MPRGGPFATALYPGAVENTPVVGAVYGAGAAGCAVPVSPGAREITTSPGGTVTAGGGAFDATAAGDGVADDDVDGDDDVPSEPSECGCSPLT